MPDINSSNVPYWMNLSLENIVECVDGIVYTERWVDIEGYSGLYQISDFGRVKTIWRGVLIIKRQRKNPENKKEVNHDKGDKSDNRYFRLSWMTPKENSQHAYDEGLHDATGENNGKSKLTNIQAVEIFNSEKSVPELVKLYGVSESTVRSIKIGESWAKVTGKQHERIYLKPEDVIAIFKSQLSNTELMAKFNMSRAAISKIRSGYSWKEITSKVV